MSTLLTGGTLVEIEPATVERGDLRVEHGRVIARAPSLSPLPEEEVVDLTGRLVMPGLVSGHHHLHASLLRGFPREKQGFADEAALLERLEGALTLDDVQAAAAAGGLEGLCSGTTTVFNLHASAKAISGSLARVAHGLNDTGIRGVLAWELSDRGGAVSRDDALEEMAAFFARARGRFRGAIGLAGLGSLSDETLGSVRALASKTQATLLINVAEDPLEEARSVAAFGKPPLERLVLNELMTAKSVVAQGVHFSWPDLSSLLGSGSWLVHACRSNMATRSGLATAAKFGVRACLGTDVMSLDVLAEAQMASLRANDSSQGIDVLRFIANGHRLASEAFGETIGPLRENAVADLLVLDYQPPTPLTADSLGAHLVHGMASQHLESVMVDGMWRLWKRKPLSVDVNEVARVSRESAQAVWARLKG